MGVMFNGYTGLSATVTAVKSIMYKLLLTIIAIIINRPHS